MAAAIKKRLRIFAGPNGSGKSTITKIVLDYVHLGTLLDCSKKFTIETVMSHPSKLNFMRKAQEKGFKVYLYFVALADPELNKHRVQTRIAQGGHPVAEEKICERYR